MQEVLGKDSASFDNLSGTLERAPDLYRRYLPFGMQLLEGQLPARDREVLILRTAWNCQSRYEWYQHAALGLRVGLTQEEIDKIRTQLYAGWDPFDATLLRAADELHAEALITDDTWAALAARYNDEQLIELPMVVGGYHMLAMTLNSIGVALDTSPW